ncbi:hypothetical protein F5H01DRAFT_268042, partial [Linnemannia elongata]
MLQAAIPVDAVTATCPAARTSQSSMSSCNRTDFPVPADPVKNTFCRLLMTWSSTYSC